MQTKIVLILSLLILLIAFLFWPTIYRYDTIKMGNNELLLKTNRFSGTTQYFLGNRWIDESPSKNKGGSSILPIDELSKVTGRGSFEYDEFRGSIYNGSSWQITDLRIELVAKSKNDSVLWTRSFNAYIFNDVIDPLTNGKFQISLPNAQDVVSTKWSIEEVRGIKK